MQYNKCKHIVTVFTTYFTISAVLTFPIIFQMGSTVFGDFGDSRGGMWWIWAGINGHLNSSINALISAPFSIPNAIVIQPVYEAMFFVPAHYIGEIAAYNLVTLLSFPFTAFATYLLLNYLLHNKVAAFVGGLIFGFCPGAVMQAVGGHLTFTFNMFIPLFLLALFMNRERRHWLSAFFVGLSYALLTLNSFYFGYFSIFIALLFVVFDYVTNIKCSHKRLVVNYFLAALFAFVLIIPFQYKMILHIMSTSHIELAKMGHIRDYRELIINSAIPLDYFLPSIDHPVLGRFIGDIARSHLHGSNLFEQTLYLGFTSLLLCLAGFFLWSNRRYHIPFFPDHARQITRHPCHHYRAPVLCLHHPRSL